MFYAYFYPLKKSADIINGYFGSIICFLYCYLSQMPFAFSPISSLHWYRCTADIRM